MDRPVAAVTGGPTGSPHVDAIRTGRHTIGVSVVIPGGSGLVHERGQLLLC
jgi:hypothetical protein